MPQVLRSAFARLFSFSSLLIGLLVLFIFFLCIGRPLLADPDIWWHLRNAQTLAQNHAFIQQDTYTFTVAGRPWINPEWLSELPYYFAWTHFGYRGLEVVAIALLEAVILGVCLLSWQRTRNIKAALLSCIAFLPLLSVSFGPRTLMVGWLCLIVELALLWEFRQGRNWLWALPPLFAFWINAHGSWPIGILFLAVYLFSGLFKASWGGIFVEQWTPAQRLKLFSVLGMSLALLFLNPYGWRLVAYPFHITLGHKLTMATVEEWQTLDFHSVRGKLAYLLAAAFLGANMVRKRTWPLYELLVTLISVLAALTYTRFLALTGIVICPLLAREFSFFHETDAQNDKPFLNLVLLAALGLLITTNIPTQPTLLEQIASTNPVKAANYLRQAPLDGPILNDFGWGGYLEWSVPTTRFFIDPRADIFDQWGVLQEYIDATGIKGSFAIIDKYHIQFALFPKNAPIAYLLTHTPGWTIRYQDDSAILLERSSLN